jgi:iron complex outermembrane receptor protein
MRHICGFTSTIVIAVLMAGAASAQETANTSAERASTASAAASDSGLDAASSQGDIVVTATRTSTLASKTPVALTAIAGDSLIQTGVTNPTQVGELVPNVSIDRVNGMQITIRGITSADATEKGDPSAAFMLDGIYIARSQAQETSFFDVSRVEVLRGPQGTLFGRNTTAGLVNVITNRPTFEFGGRVDASYGNYNQAQATAVLNVPVTDRVAVRGAVNYDRRNSFIAAGPRISSSLDPFKDNISGRLSALLDLGQGEIIVRGDYAKMGGQAQNSVLASNFFANFDSRQTPIYIGAGQSSRDLRWLNVPVNSSLKRDNNTWGIQGEFNYDLGGIGIAYLGSYREFDRHENTVLPTTSGAVVFPQTFDGSYWQNSQELRIYTTGSGPLKAQAGAYYFKEKSSIALTLFGLVAPTPGTTGYILSFPQSPTVSESYAAFGQATWSIVDSVRVTGGVRYSQDDKSRVGSTIICGTFACNQPGDVRSRNNAQRTFKKVTWRAGIDIDLDPRTLLFGTVSTGYKAGGFNDGCLAGSAGCNNPVPAAALFYEPETLTAYEIGLKTRLLDNAVRLNMAAFHYDYSGIQLTQLTTLCGGPCNVTTNAAEANVTGFEVEGTVQPVKSMLFNFSVAYLNAEYARFQVTPTVDFSGRDLDRSPGLTVIAGYTHTIPLSNGGNVEANVRTRVMDNYMLAGLSTLNQFRVPSSIRSDLNLTYNAPGDTFYLQGFVKNIENAVVVTSVEAGAFATANFADPRTYGVRAGFKF